MEKEVKSFEKVYGSYIDESFVNRVKELSHEAHARAKLNRNDQVYKDLHSPNVGPASDAVDFWSALHTESKAWLRDNAKPLTAAQKIACNIRSIFKGMKCK